MKNLKLGTKLKITRKLFAKGCNFVIMAAGGMKVLGLLVMLVLLTYLHYQVAIRSFTLKTSLPDRVTRWFGQSSENLGEEGDSDKSTNFIVGNVSNRIESMAKAGGMGSGRGSAARGAEDEAGKDNGAAKSDRTRAKRGASQMQIPNTPE